MIDKVKQAKTQDSSIVMSDDEIDAQYSGLVDKIFQDMGEHPDSNVVQKDDFVRNFFESQV